jgi:hypothetical protein
MPPMAFTVRAWDAWSEQVPPGERGSAGCEHVQPAPPVLLRRRVGPLGQHALRLAWGMACSGEARLIASSRHGEFHRSLAIMEGLVAGEGVSPAEFTLSVHHALIGLLSIARANRLGHTAVAAGPESFCFGFLDAVACLADAPQEPVLLIHYDEPLAEPFTHFAPETGSGLALVLALVADGPGEAMTLVVTPTAPPEPDCLPDPAVGFCAFLADPRVPSHIVTGPRMTWQWTRDASPA